MFIIKRLLLLTLLLLPAFPVFAATKVWTGAAAGALASTGTNWDTGTAPTTGDDVVFDGAFPVTGNDNCTWDITATIASIDTTGYTGVVTASVTMTVTGSTTFANSTFANGNQTFIISNTATITTNNNSFYNLTFGALGNTPTMTFGGNVTVTNNFSTAANDSVTITMNNHTLYVAVNFSTQSGGLNILAGTTTVELNGSGSQTYNTGSTITSGLATIINKSGGTLTFQNTNTFSGNVTFTLGTVDFGSSIFSFTGTTLTYTAGALTVGTSTFWYVNNQTLPTGFYTALGSFYNLKLGNLSAMTFTIGADITVTNELYEYLNASQTLTLNGAYTINITKDFKSTSGGLNLIAGTSDIEINGTASQNWETTGTPQLTISIPVVINKASGTVTFGNITTFSGNLVFLSGTSVFGATAIKVGGGTVTYTAGTIDLVTNSTNLTITGAATLNTNGMSWYDITMGANITLGSNLTLTRNWTKTAGALSGAYAVVFNGTSTIDGNTAFYSLTCSGTCTFDDADTFSTNASGVMAGNGTWQSDSAGVQADLNINGTETVTSGNCTDLANAGTFVTSSGTISNCTGWGAASIRKRVILMS